MRLDRNGTPFLVIGENIHATRVLKLAGKHGVELPDGSAGIAFQTVEGERSVLPVHPMIAAGRDFASGRIKHVASAIRWGLDGGANADLAAAYIRSMAARQEAAGADWLDLNADEIDTEPPVRARAIAWLVETVEAHAGIPVAIDSSDVGVLAAGIAASGQPVGRVMLNSASIERPEVLDLAVKGGCALVVTSAGYGGMPASAQERVSNVMPLIEQAIVRQIDPGLLFVDPLVLPVAVEPDSPGHVLEAARQLRAEYGDAIHITGGLSNVSFGLPERRLLNDVFITLASDAGIDSGIIDPIASDLERVFKADRDTEAWGLAQDLLEARDPFGGEYMMAFRAGRLGGGDAG